MSEDQFVTSGQIRSGAVESPGRMSPSDSSSNTIESSTESAETGPATKPIVTASSVILEDYIPAGEVSGATRPVCFCLPDGSTGLVYVGQQAPALLFYVYEDARSATGWTREPLPPLILMGQQWGLLPPLPQKVTMVAANVGSDGRVFVAVSAGSCGTVWMVSRSAGVSGVWGKWIGPLPSPSGYSANDIVVDLAVLPPEVGAKGAEVWLVAAQPDPNDTSRSSNWSVAWAVLSESGSGSWNLSWPKGGTEQGYRYFGPDTIDISHAIQYRARVVGLNAQLGNGVLVNTWHGVVFITKTSFPLAGPIGFASCSGFPAGSCSGYPGGLMVGGIFNRTYDLAVAADRSDAIDFFTATCNYTNGDNAGTIAHFDGRTLDPARMGTAASRIIQTGLPNFIYGTPPSVAALRSTDGTVRLFAQIPAFGKPSYLWVWESASGPSLSAGKEMINTGIPVNSVAAVAAGASPRKLIAVAGGKLFEIWQNAADSPDDPGVWNRVEILLPGDTGLVKCVSHSSVITFEDPHTGPLSNAKITVSSVDPTVLRTNGVRHNVGPQSALVTTLNASGSIRLNTPATRLSSTTLVLTVALADGTTAHYDLDPSAPQLKRMLEMGEQGVAALVPNSAHQADVNAALQKVKTVASEHSTNPLQALSAHQTDLPPTSSATEPVSGSAWQFTVRDSQATFAPIDDQTFATAYASFDPASASGDFFDWLGDVLEALSEVPTFIQFTLRQVGETIQGWIEVAGETLMVIANGAASFLDLCQTILHAVETAWNTVVSYFGWLLSDAAGEIWTLHTTLKKTLDFSAQTIGEQLEQAATQLPALLQSVVTGSGTWSQNAKDVPAEEDVPCSSQPGLSSGTRELAADQSSVLTWIGEQIMSLLPTNGNLPTVDQSLLQPFTNPFITTTKKVENDAQTLLNYLSDTPLADLTMDNVTKKIATVSDDLVNTIEIALSSMLKGAPGLLTATASFSTHQIDSTALRQIYNLLNPGAPEAPTMNGLVALMAAAPTVLFHRMAFPKQTFLATADQPSVEDNFNQLLAAGIYQLTVWNGIDILLDVNRIAAAKGMPILPRPLMWFFSVAMSLPLVAFTYPQPVSPPGDKSLEAARLIAWLAGACNWVFNLAHIIFTDGTPARGKLGGAIGTAFLGVCQLVALISTASQPTERNKVSPWLAVAGPLPAIAKVIPYWIPTVPPYVVPALDGVGNMAAGAAKIWTSLSEPLQTDILASTTPQLSLDATGGMRA